MPPKDLDYREQIYNSYSATAEHRTVIPATVTGLRPRQPYFQYLIREYFPKDRQARIVDLGCGHGSLLYFAKLFGYTNLSGIDRSPEQVQGSRVLGIDCVRQGDLIQTIQDLENNSLDCIVTFDVIEHFTKQELFVFLEQVKRVLKSGGTWIIHIPNGQSPFAGRIRYGDMTHEIAFTEEVMYQLLKPLGFAHISCYEDQPIAHGLVSGVRLLLWKAIRVLFRLYFAIETGDGGNHHIFSQNFLVVATKS